MLADWGSELPKTFNKCEDLHDGFRNILRGNVILLLSKALVRAIISFCFYVARTVLN